MRTIFAVLLFAATALAGCSDDAEPEATPDGPAPGATAELPTWELGDWWSFEDDQGQIYNLVVALDEGGSWQLLTNHKDIAWFDFQVDISFVGPFQKSTLHGKQGSDSIKFFDFPLSDGKMWTTQWDGETRSVVAHAADRGRFHIAVTDGPGGAKFAEYVYDPGVGFFEGITFYNVTSGEAGYTSTLTGSGSDYSGTALRFTDTSEPFRIEQQGPGSGQGTFTVADGDELYLDWDIDCSGGGLMVFAFTPPADDGSMRPSPPLPLLTQEAYGNDQPCPNVEDPDGPFLVEEVAGTWRFDSVAVTNGGFSAVAQTRTFETFSF